MKLKIEIDCDNAAFHLHPEYEVVRILQELAARIEIGDADAEQTISLRDVNGNTVGAAIFSAK